MSFFQDIASLKLGCSLKLTILVNDDIMCVTILPGSEGVTDPAKNNLQPLVLRGTAQEIDAGFLEAVTEPLKKAAGLLVNLESFEKSVERAALESAKAKKETEDNKKAAESLGKAYVTAMLRVEELEKEGKFREAYAKIPSETEFPEQEQQISKRKAELREQFSKGTLFETV